MRTEGLSVNDATVSGLVQAANRPLSAYEIMDKMPPERPRIAPMTVYHALHCLVSSGLVHRIETLNAWFAPPASTPHVGGIVTICDDHFADAHGLTFHAPEGMSTESKASAVFVENITDSRLVEQIAAETGARVGGTLYSDTLSGPDGPAATYLEMMHHNATTLVDALAK